MAFAAVKRLLSFACSNLKSSQKLDNPAVHKLNNETGVRRISKDLFVRSVLYGARRLLTGKTVFRRRCPLPNRRKSNEAAGARTLDLRIKSPLLYQLSYSLQAVLTACFPSNLLLHFDAAGNRDACYCLLTPVSPHEPPNP